MTICPVAILPSVAMPPKSIIKQQNAPKHLFTGYLMEDFLSRVSSFHITQAYVILTKTYSAQPEVESLKLQKQAYLFQSVLQFLVFEI